VVAEEQRVTTPLFYETVLALVASVQPPPESGLAIDAVTLDVPLEGRVVTGADGALEFRASLPHTRWRTGLLPPVHVAHLELTKAEA
jgi:hypothetical protein